MAATVGRLLRAHRLRRGLSQDGLAGLVEPPLSVNTIGNIERGRTRPYGHTITALADALGLGTAERTELLAAWLAADGAEPESAAAEESRATSDDAACARPNNLPAPLTSFVGRTAELARIAELLAGARLLTLTGPGGSGKTRLALEAARAAEEYADGVWLVDLAALAQGDLVPEVVAAALAAPQEPGRPVLATLAGAIGTRRMLLVLDNCEHLVGACAGLADTLLRACPRLAILATSREALNVAGETVWPVPPLELVDPRGASLHALVRSEAVRLFVDRARAVRPDFRLTAATATPVAQICRRLDGLPLAIELAAARSRQLAPAEIAARLDARFSLLANGNRAGDARHRTLRALIDWSYELLGPAEQTLLTRLSVFAGGWTLEAAEAVCAQRPLVAGEVLDLLGALVDRSLVVAEEQADDPGQFRYRLLETIRYYAAEKLSDAEHAAVKSAHSHYYTAQVEAGHHRYWSRDSAAWCRWLEREQDNLRAVMARGQAAAERGEPAAGNALLAARTAPCLNWYWYLRGAWREGRTWLASLARLRELPPNVEARLLAWPSRIAVEEDDLTGATEGLRRALEIAARSGERALAAVIVGLQALTLTISGAPGDVARERSVHAMAMATAVEPEEFARALAPTRDWWLGMQQQVRFHRAFFAGDLTEARDAARRGLAEMRRLGEPMGIGVALASMGLLAMRSGDLAGARAHLTEALEHAPHGPPQLETEILGRLATVTRLDGDPGTARVLLGRSLAGRRDRGQALAAASDMVGLAAVELESDPRAAAALLAASEALVASVPARRRQLEQAEFLRCQRAASAALGRRAFAAAWSAGAAMTFEEALCYALARANRPEPLAADNADP